MFIKVTALDLMKETGGLKAGIKCSRPLVHAAVLTVHVYPEVSSTE